MPAPKFIHLTAKTSFSLLEGMVPVKKLAKVAGDKGLVALGVTDMGNLFGAVEVSKYLSGAGVQPILGCEVPILGEATPTTPAEVIGHVTLLVQNQTGWKNLARLVSESQMRKLDKGDAGIVLPRIYEQNEGLICLSGSYRGLQNASRLAGLEAEWQSLRAAFTNRFYAQLERHGTQGEAETERTIRNLATKLDVPLVATNDCRFIKAKDVTAFEVLVGIGDSTTMDDPNRRRFTPNHALRSEDDMLEAFADLPEACANTVHIAQRCAFMLEAVSVKQMFMPQWEFSGDTPVTEVIREQAEAGLTQRLNDFVHLLCADETAKAAATERYKKQLDYELEMIGRMGFDGYFLITSDFIKWAKRQGIPVGPGRGSGAGSLVAWCLEITDLDPIRWELYFERFLNPERVSLPDFDVDFCQDRRDEVIAYVRERFGADRVSHIITFGTLKARACLRDVGRVLGLPYGFVGQVAALIPEGANPPPIGDVLRDDERLKTRYDTEDDVRLLVDTALQLEGCYRHASTHAAGVIIASRRIDEICGLYVDPRSPMPVTQFAMSDAEYAGLVKFDFLGLKTLSVIRAAEGMIKAQHQPNFDIMQVDLSDKPTYDMLKKGLTLGVFQIEGGGITELTKKMQADNMEALSAILALYRPGPLGTGMVDDYVNCKLGKAEAKYPHELLKPALEVTYGVPVYQEQIMQMARDMAGYTLGGADMLRRAMGKKKPEEMAKEQAKFVQGAKELHNIPEDVSSGIFNLMAGFAEYGFNKAHTIAYALISFQTAFLKAHFPHEFMAATMTYDRGNQDKLLRYKIEMQKMGFDLLPPDINTSAVMFKVEGPSVRHALAALKGAGEEAMRLLVAEREAKGPFKDIWDILARLEPQVINKRQLEVLAKGGVMDSLKPEGSSIAAWRSWLVHNMDTLLAYGQACLESKASGQGDLFGGGEAGMVDPTPHKAACSKGDVWDHLTMLQHEAEAVGFYLSDHPMSSFVSELERLHSLKNCVDMEDFAMHGGGACRLAGIVLGIREVKTKTGNRMGIVNLSDTTGQCEVVFFPESYAACQKMLEAGGPLVIGVKVSQEGERLRISAEGVRTLEEALGERPELVITVTNPALMGQVKGLLDKAEAGRTIIKLIVKSGQGDAVLKLPKKLGVSATMMANLRGLGVV